MGTRSLDTHRPFTVAEAAAAGISKGQLRTRRYRRLLQGCYVDSGARVTDELMAHAALKVVPSAVGFSHQTAAGLLSAEVPHSPLIHAVLPHSHRCIAQGIRPHRYATRPRMVERAGLPVTDAAQTFVDLAGELDLVDQVVLGDSLVCHQGVGPGDLVAAAVEARGRGARAARVAAAYVRGGVDSGMETRSRLLMVLAGMPEPVVNYEIRDRDGQVLRRVDLAVPEAKLAIEYDGRHHIRREQQWRSDLLRREEFEARQWRFIVLVAADIYSTPSQTLSRIAGAMRERGIAVPTPRDAWQRHFPDR